MAKNRATGYTDFYKGAAPRGAGAPISKTPTYGVPENQPAQTDAEARKEAVKRRLLRTSKAMKAKSKRAR